MTQETKDASGIHDPRFQLEEMSLRYYVLAFAGLIPGSHWSDSTRWSTFKAMYVNLKVKNGELEKEEGHAIFTKLVRALAQHVLS